MGAVVGYFGLAYSLRRQHARSASAGTHRLMHTFNLWSIVKRCERPPRAALGALVMLCALIWGWTQAQTNLDSNGVDMDRERAAFVDNSLKYEATLRFVNGSVRTILDAMKSHNSA